MVENNESISYIYDFIVHKNNVSPSKILEYVIGIIEGFLVTSIENYEIITNAKNDTQFESIIGVFRAKYREQAGVEKSVLTTFFEKQNVAMLLGAC